MIMQLLEKRPDERATAADTRERLRNEKDFDYMRGNAWIGRELECVDAMRFRTEMSEVTAAFRDPWLA